MNDRIILLDEPCWAFDGNGPSLYTKPGKAKFPRSIKIEPFPCYHHDLGLVEEIVARTEAAFPIGFISNWYVLAFDAPHHTNGFADREFIWDSAQQDDSREWEPYIVLLGKAIPLHPAMTRYLVAHEYGHVIQWWIEHKQGIKDAVTTEFDTEYMRMRGGDLNNDYGGRRWHQNVGEVIANDFRICVTGIETEFWPHPVAHPCDVPAVQNFWKEMVNKYAV